MLNLEKSSTFTYWKQPWHKWIILATAILQIFSLCMEIGEYKKISAAGILSSSALENYTLGHNLKCASRVFLTILFLGTFLIGSFARNKKQDKMAESGLCLLTALLWGAAGFIFRFASPNRIGVFWIILLLFTLGGGIYTFWREKKKSSFYKY